MEGTISKWKGMARRSLKGRLGTAMLVTIAVPLMNMLAGVIGFGVIVVFMLLAYRIPGLAASLSLLLTASLLGCVITLQLGAFSVCVETSLSGITELPFGTFLGIMQPIHLAIGLIEGLITAAVLLFVYESRPELLRDMNASAPEKKNSPPTPTVWSGPCLATAMPATARTSVWTRRITACRARRRIRPRPFRRRPPSCRITPSQTATARREPPSPVSSAARSSRLWLY